MANVCFKCGEDVGKSYQIVPLEKPYANVFFCRSCFGTPSGDNPVVPLLEKAYDLISESPEKLETYIQDQRKKGQK